MSDLISREAVLNTLDNMDKVLDENRTVEAYKDLLRECFKALPPAEPQEWISVKDGLPKEKGMYKITLQADDGYRYVAEDYFFTERNFFESEAYYRGVGRKIIAWQPITEPSPYKGDE